MQRHDHSPETWLDEADRKRLAAALAGAREARVYRRLEALLLVAEGHSVTEAARRCRVNRSSVHRWLVQYQAEHEATALIDRPRSGWQRPWRATRAAAATRPRAGRCRCWRTT
jgi:transposase